nr:cysteine rich repeat-containing protein [Bradyrhizobium sp. S69]
MVRVSAHATALWAIVAVTALATAFPAFSQAPTDAQRSAIRSACRSDYIAHCSSVPPGGMASLQCLQKNMSSLSSSCKAAVNAIEAPAEPKADAKPPENKPPENKPPENKPPETKSEAKPETKSESKPEAVPAEKPAAATAPAPKAATSTTGKKPSSAQAAAIRSACRSDYMAHCASVPTGGAAALNCLKQNKSKLSANCQQAVNAAGGGAASGAAAAPAEGGAPAQGGAAADTATAAPDAAPVAAPLVLRPMRPREILFVLRSACGGDVRALCADVPPGGGRIVQCLAAQAAQLSPACHDVLGSFAQ